jgi:hypothetical protein
MQLYPQTKEKTGRRSHVNIVTSCVQQNQHSALETQNQYNLHTCERKHPYAESCKGLVKLKCPWDVLRPI